MDKRFNLTFYVLPDIQVEQAINSFWRPSDVGVEGKVLSRAEWDFVNSVDFDAENLSLNNSEKAELVKYFFQGENGEFNLSTIFDAFNLSHSKFKEYAYLNGYFGKMGSQYNYPGMKGFLKYIINNGFGPDVNRKYFSTESYDFGFPQMKSGKINEIGDLALLVNWNFIFENEILNIPQKYDSGLSIEKNDKYANNLFSMCITRLTPLDRSPVIEAYKKLIGTEQKTN